MRIIKDMRTSVLIALLCTAGALPAQSPARDTFFMSDGVKIHYIDRGTGQPIVLLHGYTGHAERHFVASGVVANLEKDFRVIALDLRGHGASDKPHDPKAYGTQMGLDVIRLLDHLGIARAHIVGYSLGGFITGWLLTTYPDRFATATLVAGATPLELTQGGKDSLEADARELEGSMPFRSLALALAPPGQTPSDSAIRATSQALASRNDVHALAALQRGRSQLIVTREKLATVRTPALGIAGTRDVMLRTIEQFKEAMPSMKLVAVEGAEHGGPNGILRQPEFFAALRAHIATHPLR